ncbi:MAG: radical SAM protein, partial [Elusimicrobiota bacterium]
MTPKKVLLLTAPRPSADETPLHFGDNRPPIGLGYVAAALEARKHQVRIVDLYHFGRPASSRNSRVNQEVEFQHVPIDLEAEIRSFAPDFIGMYVHTLSFYQACDLGRTLKASHPGIPLLCGGPHPTVLPETLPDCFDRVVIGEGEAAAVEIVEGRAQGRIVQGTRVQDMDALPWPDYGHFIKRPYNWKLQLFGADAIEPVLSLNTTRGCPFDCTFCGVRNIAGPGYRAVSADRLVAKLAEYKAAYGLAGVYFREDNFTLDRPRLERFCDLMVERKLGLRWACESRVANLTGQTIEKMAGAGCAGLYIGVESGSPRMLSAMKKGETVEDFRRVFPLLKGAGIGTYSTWVIGLPGETEADRRM